MSDNSLFFNDIVSRRDFKEYPILTTIFDCLDKKFPEFVSYFENVNMVSNGNGHHISNQKVAAGLLMKFRISSGIKLKNINSISCHFCFDKTMLKPELVSVGFENINFSININMHSNLGLYFCFEFEIKADDEDNKDYTEIITVTCDQFFNALNPSGHRIYLKHFV